MEIRLAKSRGFCFGVKRAIKIALELGSSGRRVEMLGDIVHNEDVVRLIQKSGIRKISRLGNGRNKILLIRAHGACNSTLQKAKKYGYDVYDATCPMVKEIHKIVRRYESKGYRIIIVGDQKHDEVHGIAGQLKNAAIIIPSIDAIPLVRIKRLKKVCMVVQSTQREEKANAIAKIIESHVKDFRFFNTICAPTRMKQREIQSMPLENDVIVVIGLNGFG